MSATKTEPHPVEASEIALAAWVSTLTGLVQLEGVPQGVERTCMLEGVRVALEDTLVLAEAAVRGGLPSQSSEFLLLASLAVSSESFRERLRARREGS